MLSRWSRTWLCAWPGYRVVGLCGTGLALPLFFERERRAGTSFFDVAEICVTWWSHMEERDAAMRGRSCWTRRLVLQQRRSGCGRPRKIPSCRLDASWFLAWTKGACVRSSMEQDAESRWSQTWLCVGAWLAPLLVFQERRDGAVMAYPIGCYRTYLACMLRAVASCIFLQLWFGDDLSTYWCLTFLPA